MPTPFREGETCWNPLSHSNEPQQQEELPSLASAVSSLNILYKRWKEGTLSKTILKDFVLGEDSEQFIKRRSDGGFTEDYGPICTKGCCPPVSYTSGYDVGTRTPRKTFSYEEHLFKVDEKEISHTTRSTKGPWFQVNRGELAMAMAVVRCCVVETNPSER